MNANAVAHVNTSKDIQTGAGCWYCVQPKINAFAVTINSAPKNPAANSCSPSNHSVNPTTLYANSSMNTHGGTKGGSSANANTTFAMPPRRLITRQRGCVMVSERVTTAVVHVLSS